MINIYLPGHSSHFNGKFSDAELEEGIKFLETRYPRPPFTNSRIVIQREPSQLTCTLSDDGQYPNPNLPGKKRLALLEFDLAYCEKWRSECVREMTDHMLKLREGGAQKDSAPAPKK